jgi:tRNA G10  N-methylase Trm11
VLRRLIDFDKKFYQRCKDRTKKMNNEREGNQPKDKGTQDDIEEINLAKTRKEIEDLKRKLHKREAEIEYLKKNQVEFETPTNNNNNYSRNNSQQSIRNDRIREVRKAQDEFIQRP